MNEQLTPAQRVGIDGVKVKAVVGRYNAIRLTGPQVNALAEAAGLTGNWAAPRVNTWSSLESLGLLDPGPMLGAVGKINATGRAWLHAEGLIPE